MNIENEPRRCLAGSRVLVAEDDPLLAAELQDVLEAQGAEIVGPVPTVGAAMAALSAAQPDAAVLDVNLRSATVAPVAEALRRAAVPVVLVTAYGRDLLDDPALRQNPVLQKPVRAGELVRALLRQVARRGLSRPY